MKTITRPYSSIASKANDAGGTCPAITSIAPFMVMMAGTGGLMTIKSAAKMPEYCWVNNARIHIEIPPAASEKLDTRSTAEHLANIRDVFAINMSDLAILLEATRPTVYAWLEGQEPKKLEAVQHIQQLSRAADVFGLANIQRLDKLLQRPILEGRSLLDLLKSKEDPLVALPLLKEIGDKESRTRRDPKGSGKHRRSLEDALSESSIAIDLQG
jgi:hypothetical protein